MFPDSWSVVTDSVGSREYAVYKKDIAPLVAEAGPKWIADIGVRKDIHNEY